jgi:hypothetical protein
MLLVHAIKVFQNKCILFAKPVQGHGQDLFQRLATVDSPRYSKHHIQKVTISDVSEDLPVPS